MTDQKYICPSAEYNDCKNIYHCYHATPHDHIEDCGFIHDQCFFVIDPPIECVKFEEDKQ